MVVARRSAPECKLSAHGCSGVLKRPDMLAFGVQSQMRWRRNTTRAYPMENPGARTSEVQQLIVKGAEKGWGPVGRDSQG